TSDTSRFAPGALATLARAGAMASRKRASRASSEEVMRMISSFCSSLCLQGEVGRGCFGAGQERSLPDPCPACRGGREMVRSGVRCATRDAELLHASVVGFGDVEQVVAGAGFLARLGQVAELGGEQAADGVELLVGERGAHFLVEVLDRGERADQP